MKSNIVDIQVELHHETRNAVLVSVDGDRKRAVWVPLSVVEMPDDYEVGHEISIAIPEKVAIEKGLV